MSRQYKSIENKHGLTIHLGQDTNYFTIGPKGEDIVFRCGGEVFAFNSLEDMAAAIDVSKAAYYQNDEHLMKQEEFYYEDNL